MNGTKSEHDLNSDNIQLELTNLKLACTKTELENEKLKLEIDQLKKPWYKKISSWTVLTTLIGVIIAAGVQLFIFYYDDNSDVDIKVLADTIKNTGVIEEQNVDTSEEDSFEVKRLKDAIIDISE